MFWGRFKALPHDLAYDFNYSVKSIDS